MNPNSPRLDKNDCSCETMPLSIAFQWLYSALACALVAFGQPAWLPWLSWLAAMFSYTIFWRVLLAHSSRSKRFWMALGWFSAVQLIQLSWFISHPYWYIYFVYFILSFAIGLQFGIIGIFIHKQRIIKISNVLAISGLWTLFEWSRLYAFSGFSFNPVGLALSGNIYSLQMASFWGIYGLSFWIIFVNLLALRAFALSRKAKRAAISGWIAAAVIPYLYGLIQLSFHENLALNHQLAGGKNLTVVLVQTAFEPEELSSRPVKKNPYDQAMSEWIKILQIIKKHQAEQIDLIILPEFVVPYGTFTFIYPVNSVIQAFQEHFGNESIKKLPSLQLPFSNKQSSSGSQQVLVDNAFWVQGIANCFHCDVLVGLEDAEGLSLSERKYYSAAQLFHPQARGKGHTLSIERYEKRILVPMGEYIPFEFCKELAAGYGVYSSFTHGKEAKVMFCRQIPFSPSICYEETFGSLIREGRQKGAELLINLTNDAWYPNSKLMRQHFDHARLRTVENGVPLLRACNTGITGALNSLGQPIAILGGERPEEVEWVADSLLVNVPIYTYSTLYSKCGDGLIIALSLLALVGFYRVVPIGNYSRYYEFWSKKIDQKELLR